ncbi:MAG: type II secretion system protein [Nitrospinota bacterium]
MTRVKDGFTLVEMIGVLAVIALLSAMLAPKIFEIISDTKITRVAGEVRVYEAALANWYKDIGSLHSVNASCVPTNTTTTYDFGPFLTGTTSTGCRRYNGPYLDTLPEASIGTVALISNFYSTATTSTNANTTFDLNADGTGDTVSKRTIALVYQGVSREDFEALDNIIDSNVSIATLGHDAGGKVKFVNGSEVYVYIAHK